MRIQILILGLKGLMKVNHIDYIVTFLIALISVLRHAFVECLVCVSLTLFFKNFT